MFSFFLATGIGSFEAQGLEEEIWHTTMTVYASYPWDPIGCVNSGFQEPSVPTLKWLKLSEKTTA